jgi:hypothetical protein
VVTGDRLALMWLLLQSIVIFAVIASNIISPQAEEHTLAHR